MIKDLLQFEDLIVSAEANELFTSYNSQHFNNLTVTAVLLKTNVIYIMAHSTIVKPPVVCKLEVALASPRAVFVSPTLRQLLCVGDDSRCAVFPLIKFVTHVRPQSIPGFRASDASPLLPLGFCPPAPVIDFPRLTFTLPVKIHGAYWWEPTPESPFIIFTEPAGLYIVDARHPELPPRRIPVADLQSATFRAWDQQATAIVFAPGQTTIVTLECTGGDIAIGSGSIRPFEAPDHAQFASGVPWSFAHFSRELLTFFNADYQSVSQVDLKDTLSCVCTQHFLWQVDRDGSLWARFLPVKDGGMQLFDQKVKSVQLSDFASDGVVVSLETRIVAVWLIDESEVMDDLFVKLISNKKYELVLYLSEGLGRDVPFEAPIYERLTRGDLLDAMEIIENCPCDLKRPFAWILGEGADRLALHVILKFGDFGDSIGLIQRRILRKYDIFTNFVFQFRKVFSRATLNSAGAQPPPALQFRNRMEATIEDTTLEVLQNASKLDFPLTRVFSFSPQYTALLSQLKAMKDTTEEDIGIPGSLELQYSDGKWFYITREGTSNFSFSVSMVSVEAHKTMAFGIDAQLKVYKINPQAGKFRPTNLPPSIKIVGTGEKAVFLSIFGSIFFEDGDSIPGQYIDVSVGATVVFALDEFGVVFRIRNKAAEKILLRPFVSAIAAAGDTLVCQSSRGDYVIVKANGEMESFDFEGTFLKGLGDEAVLIGAGLLMSVSDVGDRRLLKFSDRIGRVLDCTRQEGDYVLAGSVGSPMKVLRNPIATTQTPSFAEMRLVTDGFPIEFLLKLFDKDPWRTFLLVQTRRFSELGRSDAITSLIPYLDEIDVEAATEIVHTLIQQGKKDLLGDSHLQTSYTRACFLRYTGDSRELTPKQLLRSFPKLKVNGGKTIDQLSATLLQTGNHPTVVPSLRFKEGALTAFNCGHVMNARELEHAVSELEKSFQIGKLPGTGKYVTDMYKEMPIPCQCPKCLAAQLNTYFRNK
jgi:hypothetical protein